MRERIRSVICIELHRAARRTTAAVRFRHSAVDIVVVVIVGVLTLIAFVWLQCCETGDIVGFMTAAVLISMLYQLWFDWWKWEGGHCNRIL